MSHTIAVIGATGNVGRAIINILAESSIKVKELIALGSHHSHGTKISFGEKDVIEVQNLEKFDNENVDIAIFAAGNDISKKYAKKFVKSGAIVIDNSSFFRMDSNVPLIIPEINGDKIFEFTQSNIIANPNCSTIQMLLALYPLHLKAKIKRIIVSTYQSVSGAGKEAMDELYNQTKQIFMNQPITVKEFSKQIAFNCIPQIDEFMKDGYTKEEWKMSAETKKILGDDSIAVSATCVRVPVFVGHAESINVEFYSPLSEHEAYQALNEAPGILLLDRRTENGYATQLDVVQEDAVYVSRLRKDNTVEHGLSLWVVADNIRKGAALNTIQIAELLVNDGVEVV